MLLVAARVLAGRRADFRVPSSYCSNPLKNLVVGRKRWSRTGLWKVSTRYEVLFSDFKECSFFVADPMWFYFYAGVWDSSHDVASDWYNRCQRGTLDGSPRQVYHHGKTSI
jgi:hypothetical protein